MKVSVIGTGYLGATHAACLASLGHEVIGIDAEPARIDALSAGHLPFHEPGLAELLDAGLASGKLSFATDGSVVSSCDVHFVCVGTPQIAGGYAADLSAIWHVVTLLAEHARAGTLLVGKSTVPVGTASQIKLRLGALGRTDIGVAWNPEFLRESSAVVDTLQPDRLVFGVDGDEDYASLRKVYARPIAGGVPVLRCDLATAELAKVSANLMLAARLSVVNVLAETCERSGAVVEDLVAILGADSRIGPAFLTPGLGYGGSCLPKDTRAFIARAAELGVGDSLALLQQVDNVNMRQRSRTIDLTRSLLAEVDVERPTVAVLGAAFKAGSDDVRDSPALDVAATLYAQGIDVRVHDPRAIRTAESKNPELCYAPTIEAACRDANLVLVLTDWPQFGAIDPIALAAVVASPVVLDARLALDAAKWQAAGWAFHALGRPTAS